MQQIVTNIWKQEHLKLKLISTSGPPDFSFFISVPDIFSFYDNPSILSASIPAGH